MLVFALMDRLIMSHGLSMIISGIKNIIILAGPIVFHCSPVHCSLCIVTEL